MATFSGAVLEQTVGVARQHNIEAAALLAVVQVESAGTALESDGKTPCLLFERHVFYRALKKANRNLTLAVSEGLANATWQPATQYKDQGTSQKRLELFKRAKAIDEECACQAASWGVGQILGENYSEAGFKSARDLLNYMIGGGVPAQIECFVREIEFKGLGSKLNTHDWRGFAKAYNGPGYAKNNYDVKMAMAYEQWSGQHLPDVPPRPIPAPPPSPTPPKPPQPNQTGIIASILAFFAAVWASLKTWPAQYVAYGVLVVILAVITILIIRSRRRTAASVQLGVLTMVNEGG